MSNPCLPQNDNTLGHAARQLQLSHSRQQYQWTTTLQNVEGVPMATKVPLTDQPSLPWLLKVGEVGLQLAENILAIKLKSLPVTDEETTQQLDKELSQIKQRLAAVRTDHEQQLQDNYILADALLAVQELLHLHTFSLSALINDFQQLTEKHAVDLMALDHDLAAYNALFATDDVSLPVIAQTFMDDDTFARLRVAGPNPVLITAINALPSKFPLTEEQFKQVMGTEDSLAQAAQEHRLYLLDYAELTALAASSGDNGKYVYAPIALFARAKGSSNLSPVAIQCGQDPNLNPLFLKNNNLHAAGYWAWQMAKSVVQVAEANYHELFVHLARTHLVIEAITVATHRCLAERHPLYLLIIPHCAGTLFINNAAASSLIAPDGPIDHIFGAPINQSQQAAGLDRLKFDFYANMLPQQLRSRGVDNPEWLPDYPYRDDAELVWNAIYKWAHNYVHIYYQCESDVLGDTELGAWSAEIIKQGQIYGFKPITSRKQLVDVLTMIIFTASAQHAAVNFPQKPLMSYAPAISGAGWTEPPQAATNYHEQDWQKLLPTPKLALEQLNILYLLGSVHYRRLGEYRSNHFPYLAWFSDPAIIHEDGPLAQFNYELNQIEQKINARNSERPAYTFLLPSLIPASINI